MIFCVVVIFQTTTIRFKNFILNISGVNQIYWLWNSHNSMHFLPKLKLPRKILSLILIKYICFCDKPILTKNEEKKQPKQKDASTQAAEASSAAQLLLLLLQLTKPARRSQDSSSNEYQQQVRICYVFNTAIIFYLW